MTKPSTFTKGAYAAVAGVMALSAVAGAAQAQPYPGAYGGNSYYDTCQRDAGNRGIVGALVGGAGGATIGSQFAANGHRRDGSLLGGVLGAVAGAAIGHNTAGCNGQSYAPPRGPQSSYYAPAPAPYAYEDRAERYDNRYDGDDGYRRHNDRYSVAARPDADGCTLAESPILMPDGRTQMHFVRVCMDRNGRYQVVN